MTSIPAAKLLPSVIIVATFGYLCWPYFETARQMPAATAKSAQITGQLLKPSQPPQAARDPFGNSLAFELGETSDERPGQGRKGRPAPPKTPAAVVTKGADRKPQETRTAAREGMAAAPSAVAKVGAKVESKPDAEVLGEMVLNATLLRGPLQSAMINGRVYQRGDVLEQAEAKEPLRVDEIHHHHVVLIRDGKRLELKYPQIAVAPSADDSQASATDPKPRPTRPTNPQSPKGR